MRITPFPNIVQSMNDFNLFRVNCFLNDVDSVDYNAAVLSIVCELLYENGNDELSMSNCFQTMKKDFSLKLDYDSFCTLISKSTYFKSVPSSDEELIMLTQQKYKKVEEKINTESIIHYIEMYGQDNELSQEVTENIKNLLYQSIYENINTFSTDNLKSILTNKISDNFNQADIDAFNDFLDWNNRAKNDSLYRTFSMAVDFAIVTSGRGIKKITKNVFSNKTYYLDTNIILRLIGVGGAEREESLNSLMRSCIHDGINFKYSLATRRELTETIKGNCERIRAMLDNQSLEVLNELTKDGTIKLNQSFETHYVKLRQLGKVTSIESYRLRLLAKFEQIQETFNIQSEAITDSFRPAQVNRLTEILLKAKTKNNLRYSRKAARVDAINIVHVGKIRGSNNYNYADVKSYYLTTDRNLNKILLDRTKTIAETILPSQLFLLHRSYADNPQEEDYTTFVKFLKRRNTEFKLDGSQVLKHIRDVRRYSDEPEMIKSTIKAYIQSMYDASPMEIKEERSIRKYTENLLGEKISEGEKYRKKYYQALDKAVEAIPTKFKQASYLANIIELSIIILLGSLTLLINSTQPGLIVALAIMVIGFIVNFGFRARLGFHNKLKAELYFWLTNISSFARSFPSDQEYLAEVNDHFNNYT